MTELSRSKEAILDRFREKTRIAGGAHAGYLLRLDALRAVADEEPGIDVDRGLAALGEKDLVKPTEKGDRYYLTEAGAAQLTPAG